MEGFLNELEVTGADDFQHVNGKKGYHSVAGIGTGYATLACEPGFIEELLAEKRRDIGHRTATLNNRLPFFKGPSTAAGEYIILL